MVSVRQHFSESMKALNQEIVKMGTLVEEAVRKSITALVDQDTKLARKIADEDEAIKQNRLALLQAIRDLTRGYADFSQLQGF